LGNTARFGILGPVYVTNAGLRLRPPAPRLRTLLGALLVRAPQPVSLRGLVEALWDERPPASAVANLHTYVSRLRQDLTAIGLPDLLVTDSGGYRLVVGPGQLDSHVFQTAADAARAALTSGAAAQAVALWQEAWTAWRGDPLADVPRGGWLEGEVVRLEQLVASAREDFADARLAAGQYGDVITELAGLVRQTPLREGLWQRLMLAQHRAGQRAEALATYRALRGVLVEALGVEPCGQVQELHEVILRGEPSPALRPRQLPADLDDFTGRSTESAELGRLLTRPARSVVVAITGKAGVGKSALAVRVAHEVSDQFGDGQLYVRLGGAGTSPSESATVLATLLVALGVHPHGVPQDVEARAAMYRSQLAGRQVMVVLDDVATMAQVRPLLPGSAGCAVLVTSRTQLVGAHTVHLDVLDPADSVRLLASIAGSKRTSAEPDATAAVAHYCGNLPLALRIAASRLARRGRWTVAHLAERLADEGTRLNELRIDDLEARASLAWSYDALDEPQQRAFRLLSLLDAADFPSWVLAALLDVDPARAQDVMDSLADVHLLELCEADRYRFHDLLRVFARERAYTVDPPAERTAALRRAFSTWLDLAVCAETSLPCRFLKVSWTPDPQPRLDPTTVDRMLADPVSWFDAERDALVTVVDQALDLGMTTLACDTAGVLTTMFDLRSHYDLWRRTHERALAAADRDGIHRSRAILHQGLGVVAFYRDRYGDASEHFGHAQRVFADVGEERGHAYANLGLGTMHMFHARHDDAAVELDRARAAFHRCADASGEAFARQALGIVRRNQGLLDQARQYLDSALTSFRALDNKFGQATTLFSLGLYHDVRRDEANVEAAMTAAVDLFHEASCPREQAMVLHVFAAIHARWGDAGRASDLMARSQAVFSPEGNSVDKGNTLYSMGWVAHRNHRVDEAVACFTEALRLFDGLDLPLTRTVSAMRELGLSEPLR
jgi:DNA-binding SARP family transcriptional activator/tetratricopeptide (TPR) repeat protein